ncbi:MAG: DUF2510 domain-containing protein [Microbacteriaceae bacterium]
MSDQTPPPGYYPYPDNPSEQRWWDGEKWLEPQVARPMGIVMPIFALISGVIAFFIPVRDVSLIASILAILLGAIGLKADTGLGKGLAIAGLIVGALSLAVIIFTWQ